MKKHAWLIILTALVLKFASVGIVRAEIIPPCEPGQQIGYPATVSSRAIQTLNYGDLPIVVDADTASGAKEENGFVYCTLGDSEDAPVGWINADYIFINPSWYVTVKNTAVYAWNDTSAPKVALLDKGTRLPILKEESDWFVVSLRGATGWIHK